MVFELGTKDRSIGFWLLVVVLDFDYAFERNDTEIESDSYSESDLVGSRVVFLGCILRKREADLKEAFHLFLLRVVRARKKKKEKGVNRQPLKGVLGFCRGVEVQHNLSKWPNEKKRNNR